MGSGIDLRAERRGNPEPAQYEFVLTTDVNPSRVYASRGAGGRVVRSDARGATWRSALMQLMKAPGFNVGPNYLVDERGRGGDYISGFGINPADPDHVIVTDWMQCYVTRDGGQTWMSAPTRSAEPPGRRGKGMRWINTGLVAFDPETPGKIWGAFADLHDIPNNNVISGRHYRPSFSGGVGLSTDFGVTWKDTSRGPPPKPITSVVVDPTSPKESRTVYASAFHGHGSRPATGQAPPPTNGGPDSTK